MKAGIKTLQGAGLLREVARGGISIAAAGSLGVEPRSADLDLTAVPDPIPLPLLLADHRAGDRSLFANPGAEPSGAADPRGRPGAGPRAGGQPSDGPARTGSVFPVEYVELARAETERGELVLRLRQDADGPAFLELRANGVFVMDTAEVTSEEALAAAALDLVEEPRQVLVGGLGLGFTMHRVLADPRVERCTVVEIEEALVGWMRDGTIGHGPTMLADERARPVVADVSVALAEGPPASYDLVLLDVDNGPHFLVHDSNARIYEPDFLAEARRILRPGGALAIWSMDDAPALQETMAAVFDEVGALPQPVRLQDRDEHYWLVVGRVAQENSAR